MVLMSLLKSPIASILLVPGTPRDPSVPCGHADMFDYQRTANRKAAALFLARAKRRCGTLRRRRIQLKAQFRRKTRFRCRMAYLGREPAAAIRGRHWRCQGLHKGTILPYGSWH